METIQKVIVSITSIVNGIRVDANHELECTPNEAMIFAEPLRIANPESWVNITWGFQDREAGGDISFVWNTTWNCQMKNYAEDCPVYTGVGIRLRELALNQHCSAIADNIMG